MGAATVNPVQTSTYDLKASDNPITFGKLTNIDVSSGDGVYGSLAASWTVTNKGSIQGGAYGVELASSGSTLTNTGTIAGTGTSSTGVDLTDGGTVNNNTGGKISGGVNGVRITGGLGHVTNAGGIYGTTTDSIGIVMLGGGTVTNSSKITAGNLGVYIGGGTGTLTNTGTISGTETNSSGVVLHSGGTVNNDSGATISGATGLGVYLGAAGGTVNNQSDATISGDVFGVEILGATAVVKNYGHIYTTGTNSFKVGNGIQLQAGGIVNNYAGAKIGSQNYVGVDIAGGTGTVTNAGTISGGYQGVFFGAGGTINNESKAKITGISNAGVEINGGIGSVTNAGAIQSYATHSAIHLDAGGFVYNSGTISGGGDGVFLADGGAVTNTKSITGASIGVYATGTAATVTNAGAISGGTASVEFAGPGANTLTLETGSVLTGAAIGATNALVLEGTGTADNSFDDFDTLTAKASGVWTLEASFANAHEVLVSSGTLDFGGAVTGTGTDTTSGASTLEFGSTLAATQTIDYSGRGGTLDLADPGGYLYAGSHIKDFKATDTVDLAGDWIFHKFSENSAATLATLTLQNVTSHADLSLKFAGDYSKSDFTITPGTTTTTIAHA